MAEYVDRDKLGSRSERGASLSISLLLFLICTVVAAIVLAAGTAAAGRVKNVVQSDRVYYDTTSAIELLKKEIVGKAVTISVTRDDAGVATAVSVEPAASASPGREFSVLERASIYLTSGVMPQATSSTIIAASWPGWKYPDAPDLSSFAQFDIRQRGISLPPVTVEASIQANRLILDLSAAEGGMSYSSELIASPDIAPVSVDEHTESYIVTWDDIEVA